MPALVLILLELRFRWVNALLTTAAVSAAVALYAGFHTLGAAADREATRVMRDLGFNLRIIPAETEDASFYRTGYASGTFPQEYVARFAGRLDLSYRHLVATLQRWYPAPGGGELLLTGIAPEKTLAEGKSLMIFEIAPGDLYLGIHAARQLGVEAGALVTLGASEFRVARVLAEKGSEDDVRVYGNLSDVQRLLGEPGRINEIRALECLCRDPNVDSLDVLRAQLNALMPEARVIMLRDIAKSRERTRLMIEESFAFNMAFLLAGVALWLGALAMLNVRERRHEIGVLRALGHGSGAVAVLFLGRAVLLGIAGAIFGFAAGTVAALAVGPGIFEVTAAAIQPNYGLLAWALVAAPAFTAACALAPAMFAVTQDPAQALREG